MNKKKVDVIIDKVKEYIENNVYVDQRNGEEYGFEIYVDYNERYISDTDLANISKADNPREAFDEFIWEYERNNSDYDHDGLISALKQNIPEYDDYEDEITTWIQENCYWYVNIDNFNNDIDVVIALDTGDMNSDFTECNILNYYGLYGGYGDGSIPKDSPIRWLAKQQRKLTELNKAIKGVRQEDDFYNEENGYSKFTKSVVQELQNACSHMNTLVFLVKMSLFDYLDLRDMMDSEKELNKSYIYSERTGTKNFTISKDVNCGLYDVWNGGGSVLEIELEKDVTIPIKAVWDAWIDCRSCRANGRGYDLYDVYGLTSSAYRGKITFNNEKAA